MCMFNHFIINITCLVCIDTYIVMLSYWIYYYICYVFLLFYTGFVRVYTLFYQAFIRNIILKLKKKNV